MSDTVTFEAVIVPHRSLGRRGLQVLAAGLAMGSVVVAIGLWAAGAWPAVGFTGLEAALAIWLIRRHALRASPTEMLLLSEAGLQVVTIDGSGLRTARTMPSAWLRADLEERSGRSPALMLRARGATVEVASSLGEDEKRALAGALRDALDRQRSPVFDNPQLREVSSPSGPST